MSLVEIDNTREREPLDIIEQIAKKNQWNFERDSDDQILITIFGRLCEYHLSFYWIENFEILYLSCFFDLKISKERFHEVLHFVSLVNEKILLGHFNICNEGEFIFFKESILLSGGAELNNRQIEILISTALETCDNYFQSFQFFINSTISAQDAAKNLIFATKGCA